MSKKYPGCYFSQKYLAADDPKFFLRDTGGCKGHQSSTVLVPGKQKSRTGGIQLLWPRGSRCFKLSGCRIEGPGIHTPSSSLNTCKKRKRICTKLIPHETSSLEQRFPTAPRKPVPTCQPQQSEASRRGRHPSLLPLLRVGAFGGASAAPHLQLRGRGKAQV